MPVAPDAVARETLAFLQPVVAGTRPIVESMLTKDPNERERLLGRPIVARNLLIVTALVETPIGVTLLLSPALVAGLLLGASLDAPAASDRRPRGGRCVALVGRQLLAGAR